MKSILLAVLILALAAPVFAAAETWTNVPLIDSMCAAKMKANPDAHTVRCALTCAGAGGDLGILTADGTFLKFDKMGKEKAVAALKATKKVDHVRATVTGMRAGDTITVQSLKLD